MSRRNRDKARAISAPLVDPSVPRDAYRGVPPGDDAAFEDCAHIRVDGDFFAYVMGPGRPGRRTVARPGDPIPSGDPAPAEDIPF